jgi:hypothetical protein
MQRSFRTGRVLTAGAAGWYGANEPIRVHGRVSHGHRADMSRILIRLACAIQRWLICPISALHEKFNPRNINQMPAVKFSARVPYLEQIFRFLDGHFIDPWA